MNARIRSIIDWLLIAAALGVVTFATDYRAYGDGYIRYNWLMQQVAPKFWSQVVTVDDSKQLKYPSLMPLSATPLVYVGVAMAEQEDGTFDKDVVEAWTTRINTLLLAIAMALQYWLLRGVVSDSTRRRYVLLILIASFCASSVRFFHGEIFTAMFVSTGLLAVVTERGRGLLGWPLVVVGIVNTPAHAVALCLTVGRKIWESRRLRYAAILVVTAGLVILETKLRRHGVIEQGAGFTGYEGDIGQPSIMPYTAEEYDGFKFPILFGLMGLLLSFGKGIIWWAPGMLLPWWKRLGANQDQKARRLLTYWYLHFAGVLLVYSAWWAWYAGWTFGDRFMMFAAIPATLALAIFLEKPSKHLLANIAVLLILALSLWVGVCGLVFNQTDLNEILGPKANFAREELTWYSIEFSALWRPFVAGAQVKALQARDYAVFAVAGLTWIWAGRTLLLALGTQLRDWLTALLGQVKAEPFKL